MRLRYCCFFMITLLAYATQAFCASQPYHLAAKKLDKEKPWFTGPIFTPSARVVPKGHVNLEPYIFWNVATGKYDKNWKVESTPKAYQLNPQLQYKVGLTEKINLSGNIQWNYNQTRGRSAAAFGDFPIGLDFQVYKKEDLMPIVKFSIQEVIPTGKFENLSSRKFGIDAGGNGVFATVLGITVSKLVHFSGEHFLNSRLNLSVVLSAPARVHGINVFGGDPSTVGTVYHGSAFLFLYGVEYSLTQNWALALDLVGRFTAKDRFKGHTRVKVGFPSSAQIIAAPAIEYNWSESVGVIAGSAFSIAGRNSERFASAVVGFNYYH